MLVKCECVLIPCPKKVELKKKFETNTEWIYVYKCVRITHTRHVSIRNLRPGTQCIFHSYSEQHVIFECNSLCAVHCIRFTVRMCVRSLSLCFNYFSQRTRDMRVIINISIRVVAFNCDFPLFVYASSTFFNIMTTCCKFVWRFTITIAALLLYYRYSCYCCCYHREHTLFLLNILLEWFGWHNMHECKRFCTIDVIATTKYTLPPIIQI